MRGTHGLILAGCAGLTSAAAGQIVNGGFETGSLSPGWTANPGSLVSVVTSAGKLQDLFGSGPSGTWTPTVDGGTYFARLQSGNGIGVYTLLSQEFSAFAGSELSFDIFFDGGDYVTPGVPNQSYNDSGFASLVDASSNAVVANLYYRDIVGVGNGGDSGWDPISHLIAATGTYRILFGVNNVGDNLWASAVGVDNVSVTLIPLPQGAWLGLGGLGLLAGWRRLRRS